MDPRMAARRTRVAEGRANSDLRRLLWLAGAAALVGGVIWLLTSPVLSIDRVVTYGAAHSQVDNVLAAEGVIPGRPLVAIRSANVAEQLETDPWISDASVELVFPDLVEVTVRERRSAAWISVGARWAHVAHDGVVVDYAQVPPAGAPIVRLTAADPGLGEPLSDEVAVGAMAFIGALPRELVSGVVLRDEAGEVWATVRDRPVRLGTPSDMVAKAAAVAAVIDLTDSGVIDVIAPTRPAIWAGDGSAANAQAEVEGEG